MRTYDLDLETLLSLLKDARQTGTLSAKLPAGLLGQKAPCLVRIQLADGEVTFCQVEYNEGTIQILSNEKSFGLLYGLGALSWRLDTDSVGIPSAGTTLPGDKNKLQVTNIFPPERRTQPLPPIQPVQPIQPMDGRRTANANFPSRNTTPLPSIPPANGRRMAGTNPLPPIQQPANGQRTTGTNPLPPIQQPTNGQRMSGTNPLPPIQQPTNGQRMPGTNPLPPIQQPTNGQRMPGVNPLSPGRPTGNLRMTPSLHRLFLDIPHIAVNIDPETLHTLSRRHRRVLALVDGTRSVEKIAGILFSTPQDAWTVLELLQDLEAAGLIIMGG